MNPKLTDAGKNLLLRALTGETITFTKIQLGNGSAQEANTAIGLVNPLIIVELSKIEVGKAYVTLTATFTNGAVTGGFHITEAGFYAKDPEDETKEILYALGNEDESTADYVPDNTNRIFEMEFNALLFIGDAENVAATINSSLVYATAADLTAHTDNKENPHRVTKEHVGLGNVPNVSTNDQSPTYTDATVLATLSSGEKISVAFSKIKLAITNLINHIGNKKNPHSVTATQVGAATKSHVHNTTDINMGILGTARGGTGVTSYTELSKKMLVCGTYIGDGEKLREINIGATPRAVLIMDYAGRTNYIRDGEVVHCGGLAVGVKGVSPDNNYYLNKTGYSGSGSHTIAGITTKGFWVNFDSSYNVETNVDGIYYNYIAVL